VLHLKIDWWWVVAGSYCLAWSAGFLAIWAPGGIGVRELVFVATMSVVIPASVRNAYFPDRAALAGLLVLVGFLLRLWTIAGELMLTAVAYVVDFRGAMNRPDAPGRVAVLRDPEPTDDLTPAESADASTSASKHQPAHPAKLKPSSAVPAAAGSAPKKAFEPS
jgi:hypothetical protein